MNAFPHRKKVNIPMLALMIIMTCLLIYCDIYYGNRITIAITREENRIDPTGRNIFVAQTLSMLNVHKIILIVGMALVALLPVYTPMLKKINTNVNIEGNNNMTAIDISGEDN